MLGTNPVEPLLRGHDGRELDIVDVFPTIQGEGPFAGRPATFVRLAGCHLACTFCDTDFLTDRRKVMVKDLTQQLWDHPNRLVVLTGGEPMRQNIVPLCDAVTDRSDRIVQIETAGNFWQLHMADGCDDRLEFLCHNGYVHIVVSPKSAQVNARIERWATAWKYIITATDPLGIDGLPVHSTQDPGGVHRPLARPPRSVMPEDVYLQPCDTGDVDVNKQIVERCVALCKQHGYRLSLQQHKLLGLP